MDPVEMTGMISVCLLADLFGVDVERVARDVVRYRTEAAKTKDETKGAIWR
jgi:hypothetical protein